MSEFYNNSIFWVEVDRISPNPYQPRKEFDDEKIAELADSLRQYGVLQPLVVTRRETEREDGGIAVEYELIAGERRLRAAKLAGLPQVPVIIRAQDETDKMKLELAIIENLQREDLNAIDRARAFKQLVDEFSLKHAEVAKKVGKSREYVSNTLRLLALPEHIQQALIAGKLSEGHARPLLMLGDDHKDEREALFLEIQERKLTVRETERIARRIATEKRRSKDIDPEFITLEKQLTEKLGTRVQIEKRSKKGGKVHIDYFSDDDLRRLLALLDKGTPVLDAEHTQAKHNTDAGTPAVTGDALDAFNNTFSQPQQAQVTQQVAPVADEDPFANIDWTLSDDDAFDYVPVENTVDDNQYEHAPTHTTESAPSNPFAELPPLPPLEELLSEVSAPAPQPSHTQAGQIPQDLPSNTQDTAPRNPFAEPFSEYELGNDVAQQGAPQTAQTAQKERKPFNPFAIPA